MKKNKILFTSLFRFTLVITILFSFGCEPNKESRTTNNSNYAKGMIASEYTIAFYNVENLFDTENDPHTSDDEFTPSGDKKWTEKKIS